MKYFLHVSLFSFCLVIVSCSSRESEPRETLATTPDPQVADTSTNRYEAEGRVISILPNKKNFIVRHGDIPGFMSAMTMPFGVADSSLLSEISPQDSIHFVIEGRQNEMQVTGIKKIDSR